MDPAWALLKFNLKRTNSVGITHAFRIAWRDGRRAVGNTKNCSHPSSKLERKELQHPLANQPPPFFANDPALLP